MTETSTGTAAASLCSKCGTNPRGAKHGWCNQCKAEAQTQYERDRESMVEARGFALGVKAMRDLLLVELVKAHPGGLIRVGEFATWIARMTLPRPEAEKPETQESVSGS